MRVPPPPKGASSVWTSENHLEPGPNCREDEKKSQARSASSWRSLPPERPSYLSERLIEQMSRRKNYSFPRNFYVFRYNENSWESERAKAVSLGTHLRTRRWFFWAVRPCSSERRIFQRKPVTNPNPVYSHSVKIVTISSILKMVAICYSETSANL
jgi:hypothetical protein